MDKLFRHLPFVFNFLKWPPHCQPHPGLTFVSSATAFSGSPWQWSLPFSLFLGHMIDEAVITPLPSHVFSPSLSVVSKKVGSAEVLGDVSTGVFRPLLPARFRSAALLSLHNIHHPGVRATRRLICSSFCWQKMGVLCPLWPATMLAMSEGKGASPRVAPGCPHSGSGSSFLAHPC